MQLINMYVCVGGDEGICERLLAISDCTQILAGCLLYTAHILVANAATVCDVGLQCVLALLLARASCQLSSYINNDG